jgi:hypothetical protein
MAADHSHAPSSTEDLERRIRGIETQLEQMFAANRTGRLILLCGSALLVGMMLLFGSSLWRTLQKRMTAEKLQAALTTKVDTLWEPMSKKLVDEVMQAAPAYSSLAAERATKVWPVLSDRLIAEFGTFAEDMETMLKQRSEAAMQRMSNRLKADLKKNLPALTDERIGEIALRLHDRMIEEGGGVAEELQATVLKEQDKIAALLDKLPIDKTASASEADLQKRFVHHALLMLDAIVTETDFTAAAAGK